MPDRGSAKLLSAQQLSKQDLARIVSVVRSRGVKVVDWHILGQPAPEAVTGTIQVSAGSAASVIGRLVSLGSARLRPRLEVFPLGIPRPDIFNVRFRF